VCDQYDSTAYLVYDEVGARPLRTGPVHAARGGRTLCGVTVPLVSHSPRYRGSWVEGTSGAVVDCARCVRRLRSMSE
jgi:hypothetical protein